MSTSADSGASTRVSDARRFIGFHSVSQRLCVVTSSVCWLPFWVRRPYSTLELE